jgi:chaperonin cofactor prefoldin
MGSRGVFMLDPVSLIVAALVRALMGAAQQAGSTAGRDAYQVLKAALVRKYGKVASSSIDNLERDPGSPERQDQLAATLGRLGAGNDQELLRLSEQILQAIEQGVWVDPVEQPKRTGGVRAIAHLLDEHVKRVTYIRANYLVEDSDLLSSRISRVRDVPNELRTEISALHDRIRQIIGQVAWNIENDKYRDAEDLIQSLQGRSERERAVSLVNADKEIRVSYETLRLTVSFFSELNTEVLSRIETESSVERQNQMMFGNGILIYELADFVIGYIEDFVPGGFQQLEALHQDTLRRVQKTHADQELLITSARRPGIEPGVRDGILEDVKNRAAALTVFQEEWEQYVVETKQFHGRVRDVQNKIPTLELIRENARVQLDVLELVSMLRFLRQNADAVRAAVETLQGFRLAPLTPTRVRRLLGPRA